MRAFVCRAGWLVCLHAVVPYPPSHLQFWWANNQAQEVVLTEDVTNTFRSFLSLAAYNGVLMRGSLMDDEQSTNIANATLYVAMSVATTLQAGWVTPTTGGVPLTCAAPSWGFGWHRLRAV